MNFEWKTSVVFQAVSCALPTRFFSSLFYQLYPGTDRFDCRCIVLDSELQSAPCTRWIKSFKCAFFSIYDLNFLLKCSESKFKLVRYIRTVFQWFQLFVVLMSDFRWNFCAIYTVLVGFFFQFTRFYHEIVNKQKKFPYKNFTPVKRSERKIFL